MLFSIIVPAYNVERWLTDCIESVLAQNKTVEYELILVDDGSTDNSGKIADNYSNSYSNIAVLHKENGGLSSARNAGLEVAKGEYVLFLILMILGNQDFLRS